MSSSIKAFVNKHVAAVEVYAKDGVVTLQKTQGIYGAVPVSEAASLQNPTQTSAARWLVHCLVTDQALVTAVREKILPQQKKIFDTIVRQFGGGNSLTPPDSETARHGNIASYIANQMTPLTNQRIDQLVTFLGGDEALRTALSLRPSQKQVSERGARGRLATSPTTVMRRATPALPNANQELIAMVELFHLAAIIGGVKKDDLAPSRAALGALRGGGEVEVGTVMAMQRRIQAVAPTLSWDDRGRSDFSKLLERAKTSNQQVNWCGIDSVEAIVDKIAQLVDSLDSQRGIFVSNTQRESYGR